MEQISRIGTDTSKHFFQLHGVNAAEKVVLRKKLRRNFLEQIGNGLTPGAGLNRIEKQEDLAPDKLKRLHGAELLVSIDNGIDYLATFNFEV